MSAQVVATKTADGWDVHVTAADDVVVRTVGERLTVAVVSDDDDTPTPPMKPLDVTLDPTLYS